MKVLAIAAVLLAVGAQAQTTINGNRAHVGWTNYCAAASGSGTAYACTISGLTGYATGAIYYMKVDTANTGSPTVNFSSLGAKTIKKVAGGAVSNIGAGELAAGQLVTFLYDGTYMQITSALGGVTDLTPTVVSASQASIGAGSWRLGTSTHTITGSVLTVQTYAVSNATYTSPIVLTVADMTGSSIKNGDTVCVSDVLGNTAANGTWTIELTSYTTIRLIDSTGSDTYTGGGTVGPCAGATGSIKAYGTTGGYVQWDFTAATGIIATCTGSCEKNQVTTPTFPANGMPIATYTVSVPPTGISAVTSALAVYGATPTQAGTGLSESEADGMKTYSVSADVARMSGTNSFTGANTFASATSTAPHKVGTSVPATCTVGQTFFKSDATAGNNVYLCTATNTWTQVTTAGATQTAACGQFVFNSPAANDTQYSLPVPMASTIVGWAVQAVGGSSPTFTVDIWKAADGGTALPTVSDTITASAKPALATGNRLRSTSLTGWTTAVTAYDVLAAKIDAISGSPTQVSVSIFCTR